MHKQNIEEKRGGGEREREREGGGGEEVAI